MFVLFFVVIILFTIVFIAFFVVFIVLYDEFILFLIVFTVFFMHFFENVAAFIVFAALIFGISVLDWHKQPLSLHPFHLPPYPKQIFVANLRNVLLGVAPF